MTAIVGYNGSFKIGTYSVAEIGDWNLSLDMNIYDVTKLGDGWKDTLGGLRSWNGKATGRWDMTDTNGQVAIQTAYLNGTSITVNLYTEATHYYSGTAWVKALNIKDGVNTPVDFEITFDGTGAITYT